MEKPRYNGSAFWDTPIPPAPDNGTGGTQPSGADAPTQTATPVQAGGASDASEFHPVLTPQKPIGPNTKKVAIIIAAAAVVIIAITAVVIAALTSGPEPSPTPVTIIPATEDPQPEPDSVITDSDPATEAPAIPTEAPTQPPEEVVAQVEYETRKVLDDATYFKRASASSVLPDQEGHNYSASNVLRDDGTCWCENAKDYGEGEWIKLELPAVQRLSGLRIVNGYAGTEKQYDYNSKISKALIEFSDGSSTTVTLNVFSTSQRKTVQNVSFNRPIETDYVKITILGVTKGDCKDTCLTFVEPY